MNDIAKSLSDDASGGIDRHRRDQDGQPPREKLHSAILEHGYAVYEAPSLSSPDQLNDFVTKISWTRGALPYAEERASPRTTLNGEIYTSTEYPAHLSIFPHNECSSRAMWPGLLFFACKKAPQERGGTTLCDGRKVTAELSGKLKSEFRERGLTYYRNYGKEVGPSLEYGFNTTDREEIERYCERGGISYEWLSDTRLRTTARRSAFIVHPLTNEELWFNYAMFYSPLSLEEKLRRFVVRNPPRDRALGVAFGDGEPIPDDYFSEISDIINKHTIVHQWQENDIVIIDNMRFLHGREPFSGDREIWFAMADPVLHDDVAVKEPV